MLDIQSSVIDFQPTLYLSTHLHPEPRDFKTYLNETAAKWYVMYFYPKDNTPGCSNQAVEFNRLYSQFKKLDAEVIGVSRDNLESHQKFSGKFGLSFALASDTDEALCKAFDVIREKNMFGKKVLGLERSTFLINSDGVIVEVWRKVKASGHAEMILNALTTLVATKNT